MLTGEIIDHGGQHSIEPSTSGGSGEDGTNLNGKGREGREADTNEDRLASPLGGGLGRPYFTGAAALLVGLVAAVLVAAYEPWGPEQRSVLSVVAATAAATTTVPTGLLLLARYRLGGRRSEVDAGLIVLLIGAFWLLPTRVGPMLAPEHGVLLAPFATAVALVVVALAWSASRLEPAEAPRLGRRLAVVVAAVGAIGSAGLAFELATALTLVEPARHIGSVALAISAGLMLLAGYRSESWALTFIGMELLGLQMGELFASRSGDVTSGAWLASSVLVLVGATIGTLGALAVAQTAAEASQRALLGATVDKVRLLQLQATTEERMHDLRSGLFSVEAFASTLMPAVRRDAPANDPGVSVDLLVAELSRLRELVSVARRGVERFDFSDGVRQVVESRRAAGARISLDLTPGIEVLGDRGELCEVVQNLLDNARLHGGDPALEVTVSVIDDQVGLTVADDGPGFDPDTLPMVFERGFSTSAEGTGLGLHIVRRTVETMGGTVAAMNRPTGGALVRLTLPGRARRPVASPETAAR